MRRESLTVLAAAVMALAASAASAADLPRKAPPAYTPPAPPPITWTGCYIGANIGGAFGRAKAEFNFGEVSTNGSGFAGGGQIGCDYQFAGGWVIGFRNMFDGTSDDRDVTISNGLGGPFNGATVNFKNQWFDTLTGRLGYSWGPTWLTYFQGGAVWSKTEATITNFGHSVSGVNICSLSNVTCDFGSASRTRTGWTIGGGVEWRFAPQWSAFLEGNWMDFGSNDRNLFFNTPLVNVGGGCVNGNCTFNNRTTAATVLVGLNYRFNWGKAPY